MANEVATRRGLSFGGRIVAWFVLVLLSAQAATLFIVDAAVDKNVHEQLADRLAVGERVWDQVSRARQDRLRSSVAALAGDFAFREALATGDASTALSALVNHSQRIGADAALLLSPDGEVMVGTGDGDDQAQKAILAPLVARARTDGGASGLVLLDGQPFEVALAPAMAPTLIGWVVMGRPVGAAEARDFRTLTGLELALGRTSAGRLRFDAGSLSGQSLQALAAVPAGADGAPRQIELAGETYYQRVVRPSGNIAPDGEPRVEVRLLAGIDAAVAPYAPLKRRILLLATLAVAVALAVAVVVGRGVTRPIARLAQAAARIAQGDYASPLPVSGHDEISALADTFNRMQDGIAERESRIRYQASHDSLTGLPNRLEALDALQAALARAARDGTPCAVLMLDLDRFKEINDTLGHAFGDSVLSMVGARLRQEIRSRDVLARLGGDEFVVLLPGSSEQAATERAWALVESLRNPLDLGEGKPQISVDASIGIAVYPTHGSDADTLLRRADIAMYEAKQTHGKVTSYARGHDEIHLRQIRLIGDLRQACERGEFALAYQPKIDMAGGRVAHVEALLRWEHAELGAVAPDEFIPLAERAGLIHGITDFVLDHALRQIAEWKTCGIQLDLAINVSALDLADTQLTARVSRLLEQHGVAASELIIEITEGTAMRDLEVVLGTMRRLRALGIRLSIDDFGTGHSSLAQLRSLPVDEIKIDKSFVMRLAQHPEDTVIVRSAIEIGHNMGLSVIAEGVEHADCLEILRGLKCDMVQGYLFSRPVGADTFRAWYQTFNEARHTRPDVAACA